MSWHYKNGEWQREDSPSKRIKVENSIGHLNIWHWRVLDTETFETIDEGEFEIPEGRGGEYAIGYVDGLLSQRYLAQ